MTLNQLVLTLGMSLATAFLTSACAGAQSMERSPTSLVLSAADRATQELTQVGIERFTAAEYKPGVVRHIVLFRYKPGVTAAEKAAVVEKFLALKELAQRNHQHYIISIEAGSERSGEGADQGLEQGFIVTFKSEGDRNYYVGQPVVNDPLHYDPAHQAFKDFVGPLLDTSGALVFDFAPGKF